MVCILFGEKGDNSFQPSKVQMKVSELEAWFTKMGCDMFHNSTNLSTKDPK